MGGRKQAKVATAATDVGFPLEEVAGSLGLGDSTDLTLVKQEPMGRLWAGYGFIKQLTVKDSGSGQTFSLVEKQVKPPAGSGESHNRKLHSYQVEAYFYTHLAPALLASGQCAIPTPLFVSSTLGQPNGVLTLVMSDLRPKFSVRNGSRDLAQAKVVLDWLAGFHAHFWEQEGLQEVWEVGCYWHLDTRMEEFDSMDDEYAGLKAAAHAIDRRLKGILPDGSVTSAHRTLTHGDMKSENILFAGRTGDTCAAYDLQYVGYGYGTKDLAYFFTSSVAGSVMQRHEEELLDHYHAALCSQLTAEQAAAYTREVMVQHYQLSLLDYLRFMAGWGLWGSAVGWITRKQETLMKALQQLLV